MSSFPLVRRLRFVPWLALLLLLTVCQSPALAQWKFGHIVLEGNSQIGAAEIMRLMTSREGKPYAEWKLDEDRAAILSLYRSRGFLQAEVADFEKDIEVDRQSVNLRVMVDEGLQTILHKIDITGNTIFSEQELLGLQEITLGLPLDARRLALLKQKILSRYYQFGYLYVEVEERFYFPSGNRQAEVYFDIHEGVQVRVDSIRIQGNQRVGSAVILRGMELKPGDIYTDDKMSRSKSNLYRIGVLRDIRHELVGYDSRSERIVVAITVTEGEFHSTSFGGGVGDVDGLRGFMEWSHYNLFRRALSLTVANRETYQAFQKDPTYKYSSSSSLTLRQPYFLNSRIEASTTGLFEKVSYRHHEEEKTGINFLLRNMVTLQREISLLMELNSRNIFAVDTLDADKSIIDNRGRRITQLVSPVIMLDRRNDRFNPSRGYQVVMKSTLAGGPFLLGAINYYMLSFEGTLLHPLISWRNRQPLVLAARLKTGVVREFGGTTSVPPTEQFNIGGGRSLRGYGELSIGPIADRDMPGNVLLLTNLELRYPLWRDLGGVAFLDAANVFRELYFDSRFHLLTSGGVGLRYRTPVGPIRVDAAWRLNGMRQPAGGGKDWGSVHFGIGHAF
ncbi:BamA/TamA family outer membrane protein [bacterium]|nr:BamA/TamA family outer membrane protein [bacterium]